MKDIIKTSQSLTRKDFFLILLPIMGIALAHSVRPYVMQLSCAPSIHTCLPVEVSSFDRIGIRPYVGRIDEYSFYAEYAAGFFAVLIPLAWWLRRIRTRLVSFKEAMKMYGRDLAVCIEAALWNGFLNECTRLIVQRPRPFVYLDPGAGNLGAHYNSFFSGHTSFSAVAMVSMVLVLKDRGASRRSIYGFCILAFIVTALTGIFRVFAGRHFPTDVIAGAIFGTVLAWVICRKIASLNKIVLRS